MKYIFENVLFIKLKEKFNIIMPIFAISMLFYFPHIEGYFQGIICGLMITITTLFSYRKWALAGTIWSAFILTISKIFWTHINIFALISGICLLLIISLGLGSILKYKDNLKKDLLKQKAYFQQLYANSPEAIALIDINGKVMDINQGFTNIFGFKRENIIDKNIDEVLVPENNIKKGKTITKKACTGKIIRKEVVRQKQDGSFINVDLLSFPITTKNEQVGLFAIYRDITRRKRTENNLRESEQKFKSYIDNAPIGIFTLNRKGNFKEVNDTICKITGYNKKQLSSMSFHDIISKEFKEKTQKGFDILTETGLNQGEITIVTQKNKIAWIKINAVKLAENKYLGFAEDITKRKQVEKAVNKQRAYFQQLFDNSPEAIALLDNQARVIRINKSFEKTFGYKQNKIEGIKITEIIIPDDKREESKNILQQIKDGKTYTGETIRKTKDGSQIYVSLLGYPIKMKEDQIGIYAVYNNITDRKKEEEKIKYLSFHDQLTGLYNRRYFENEMDRLNKSRRLPISIIIADLDNLKKINDTYGHKEGDQCIKTAANIMNNATRDEDIVARIGGDEFAVILPETNREDSRKIIKRINKNCNKNNENRMGISAGYETKTDVYTDLNEVFKRADKMMYRVKRQKKQKPGDI